MDGVFISIEKENKLQFKYFGDNIKNFYAQYRFFLKTLWCIFIKS